MGDIANKDEAFKCLDIARAALKAGDHGKAEKFASKALRLYRCGQTESMVLQVQVYVSEMTRGAGSDQPQQQTPRANGTHHQQQQHQQQHQRSSQQQHSRQQQAHHSSRQHHQHQHQQQHNGSSHRQQPRGMGGSEGLRHRASSAAAAAEAPVQEHPSVTPEQQRVVHEILAAKTLYDVLGVPRDAGDSDIKSAYRKLALRLHPDKNKAHKADEAFKLLSKAFSCLSNPDKRAYYDRTGYESTAAAQAAAASSARHRGSSNMGNGSFFYSGPEEFDAEEIFNAFFGAGAFHPHASRVFRSQFGGFPGGYAQHQQQRQRPPTREEQQRAQLMGLMQVLPILLIVLVTLFSTQGEPVYSLAKDAKYTHQLNTGRLGVSFWVKDRREFDKTYPLGHHKRLEVERHVETDVYERVYQRCQSERMAQHRAFTWGNKEAARRMELANCQELAKMHERMGSGHRPAGTAY